MRRLALFACQLIVQAITAVGGECLLTAKPSSYKALYDLPARTSAMLRIALP